MSKIKLIVMGQLTDRYYREAADEYIKRMSRTSPVTEVELKCIKLGDDPTDREIVSALAKEGDAILAEIPKRSLVCAMCIEGKQLSSEELADKIAQSESAGTSELCFIISYECLSGRIETYVLGGRVFIIPVHAAVNILSLSPSLALTITGGSGPSIAEPFKVFFILFICVFSQCFKYGLKVLGEVGFKLDCLVCFWVDKS